jgi:SAM-dependent methyltransferase
MANHARKSTLRRFAGRLRRSTYRCVTAFERLIPNRNGLLPPAHLRAFYYESLAPQVFARACGIRAELIDRGLKPEHRVLDVGCGIGNLAIGLKEYLRGEYHGIDIHKEAIAWCQHSITPRHPNFRFHHADVTSRAYNPSGTVEPSAYVFPFPDRSFDYIFLASVFTHMLPDGVEHYIHELARLLSPTGQAVASYFLLNDETTAGVDANRSFMSFAVGHPSGVCRLHDANLPEAAVAFSEAYVRQAHQHAGLSIRDVRRGGWWRGETHDQDVVCVAHRMDE